MRFCYVAAREFCRTVLTRRFHGPIRFLNISPRDYPSRNQYVFFVEIAPESHVYTRLPFSRNAIKAAGTKNRLEIDGAPQYIVRAS